MAKISGKNTKFWLDNSAGSLANLSTSLNEVNFPREQEELETTVFGSSFRTYITGFQSGQFSVSGFWTTGADAHLAGIMGTTATRSYEYSPDSTATGKRLYKGEAVLLSYEITSGVNDVTAFSASLRASGAITSTVH